MDFFGIMDIPNWLLLLLFGLLALYVYGTWPYSQWRSLGVPGPPPTIFLGNMPELFKPGGHLRAAQDWQAKYGTVFGIYNFRAPILYVTDPNAIKQVLVTDFNSFVDRHFFSDRILVHKELDTALFFACGSTWKRIRMVMSPMLSSSKLRAMSVCLVRCSRLFSDKLMVARQPVDVRQLCQAFALDSIAATAFSLDTDTQANPDTPLVQHARSLFKVGDYIAYFFSLAALFPALTRPVFKFFNYGIFKTPDLQYFDSAVNQMIADRHKTDSRDTDLLQLLIDAEVEEEIGGDGSAGGKTEFFGKKLRQDEIVGQCLIMYIAGLETTSSALQFLFYLLAKHEDVQNKLIKEIDDMFKESNKDNDSSLGFEDVQKLPYLQAVIQESLRMYPPASIIFRLATQDATVANMPVPAGTGLWIPVHVVNRDPNNFPDPDKFNPERWMLPSSVIHPVLSWLAFGGGPRHCVGQRLALLELKLCVVRTLRYVSVASASPDSLVVSDITSMLTPTQPIMVTFNRRDLDS